MDPVDLINDKRFVGQEFLTWLWWKSEERGGAVKIGDEPDILVVFEKHMLLEYGEAEDNERLVCSGMQTELKEARTGLRTGKKLEQARIRLVKNEQEYHLTLGATLFEFRNVRLPRTETSAKDGGGADVETEGMILERIFLYEELVRIVDDLFRLFLEIRVSPDWQHQLATMRTWVHTSADSV